MYTASKSPQTLTRVEWMAFARHVTLALTGPSRVEQAGVERAFSSWVEEGRRWEWRVKAQHNPPSFQPLMRNPILRNWAPQLDASRIWKPLKAEWWTQPREPIWSPKDTGREENGNCVNGHPVQNSEQEMEPLKRKMKCKWRGKDVVFYKDTACGWTPIESKMGPKLLTAKSVCYSSINKVPPHLFLC